MENLFGSLVCVCVFIDVCVYTYRHVARPCFRSQWASEVVVEEMSCRKVMQEKRIKYNFARCGVEANNNITIVSHHHNNNSILSAHSLHIIVFIVFIVMIVFLVIIPYSVITCRPAQPNTPNRLKHLDLFTSIKYFSTKSTTQHPKSTRRLRE